MSYESEKLTAQFTYTWSRSWRSYKEKFDGLEYPYHYDRPHKIGALIQFAPSGKMVVGLSWQFASGNHITLGGGNYEVLDLGEVLLDYISVPMDEIHTLKLPGYHRMDISLQYSFGKKMIQQIKCNLLNVYNRINTPYATLYKGEPINEVFLRTGLPLVPTLTYRFTI